MPYFDEDEWKSRPTAEDESWAESVDYFHGGYEKPLAKSVADNNGNRVYHILQNASVTQEEKVELIKNAIASKHHDVLDAVLKSNSMQGSTFDLTETNDQDNQLVWDLYEAAIKGKDSEAIAILWSYDKGEAVTVNSLLELYADNNWGDGFALLMQIKGVGRDNLFRLAVDYAAETSDDFLTKVLGTIHFCSNVQGGLDQALVKAAGADGSLNRVVMLLKEGADPNYNEGKAFLKAAEQRNLGMVKAMVEHGLKLDKFGKPVLSQIKKLKAQSPVVDYLEEVVPQTVAKAVIQKQEDKRYSQAAKSILKDTLDLTDGPRLTTLFNFETRQQIVIVEGKNGMTTTIKDFGEVDQDVIRKAADELKKLNGDVGLYDLGKKRSITPLARKQ